MKYRPMSAFVMSVWFLRLFDHIGADRIEVDVPGQFEKIGILLYEYRFVPPTKKMPCPFSFDRNADRVGAVDGAGPTLRLAKKDHLWHHRITLTDSNFS